MKILNFGSLNIDYAYNVDHFVRPGETVSSVYCAVSPGGKGLTQSVALARCCKEKEIDIFHAGYIGNSDGSFLKNVLEEAGVNTGFIKESDVATGHTIIQIDYSGQNCMLMFGGANMELQPDFIDSVFSHFSQGDYLVLQNEINGVAYIIQKAHEKGLTVFLNPSPYNDVIDVLPLEYVDCLILNEVEAYAICKTSSTTTDRLLFLLGKKLPDAEIVLTLGKQGVVYKRGNVVYHHGIYEVPVMDKTAAEDAFTGYFIGCRVQNMNVHDILKYASVASSITISRKGSASSIPTMQEVKTADLKPVK